MCELLAMSCRHPARLTFSLAALAARAQHPSSNRDGWGIAFYQGADVALYRDTQPADNSPLLDWLTHSGPATQTAIGYIRHGTQGGVTLANTGPFLRELNGRIHTFAHNGNLRCAMTTRDTAGDRFQPIGNTDSERAFCTLLAMIATLPLQGDGLPSLAARLSTLAAMARQFRDCGPGNFVYADGDVLFVHAARRYQDATGEIAPPALHAFACDENEARDMICESESPRTDGEQRVVLIATVPLSDRPWRAIARGEILALRHGEIVGRLTV